MNANVIGFSLLILAISLLVAKIIRVNVGLFSKYFFPSSIVAGALLLLLGLEVLGKGLKSLTGDFVYGIFTEEILTVFSALPGLLITAIFAGLFLEKKIPNIKSIWLTAGPQVSYGQTAAWGQYVFGILVRMLLLVPLFDANPMAGALIEIAFEGAMVQVQVLH